MNKEVLEAYQYYDLNSIKCVSEEGPQTLWVVNSSGRRDNKVRLFKVVLLAKD